MLTDEMNESKPTDDTRQGVELLSDQELIVIADTLFQEIDTGESQDKNRCDEVCALDD